MRIVFADTGYWVALLNPHDDLHNKALHLSQSLQPLHIITSEMVLVEVLNDFSSRGPYLRQAAVTLIRSLYQNPNTTIIPQTSQQLQTALALYNQRSDKDWSPTDCVSFQIMAVYKMTEALAYDKHFIQAGYVALMRRCQVSTSVVWGRILLIKTGSTIPRRRNCSATFTTVIKTLRSPMRRRMRC